MHTSEALPRAQLAHAAVPKGMLTTEGDSNFDEPFGEDGSYNEIADHAASPSEIPDWVFSHNYSAGDFEREILRQYKRAMEWENDEDPMKKTLSMFVKDNLRLHKSHFNQVRQKLNDLRSSVSTMKGEVLKNLDDRIPFGLMSKIRSRVEIGSKVNASLED